MTERKQPRPLAATEFVPLDATGTRRRIRVPPVYLALGVVLVIAVSVFAYLFAARAVIFHLDPRDATLNIGGLSFHIGDNFLLLPGQHTVNAEAEGYQSLTTTIEVGAERTQEVELRLEPLPGNLRVSSALDGIEVLVDGDPAGVVPGVIRDISRGTHTMEFRKHRYFPVQQTMEIEGLGRTQAIEIELEPAWGEMQISSVPEGAEVLVDGHPVGVTPLTTEVLETGTLLTLAKRGFRTWEKQVSVRAGTTAAHPPVRLAIADGTVEVRTSPAGAHVRVDGEFRGTTPVSIEVPSLADHRIDLLLEGYRKATRTVRLEPEQHSTLMLDLAPIIGRIQLSVTPPDAEVVVNGRSQGLGSRTLDLIAREHELTVRKDGFESRTQTIMPREDLEQSLEIRLLTLEQAYWATRPPAVESVVGARLKLFRPTESFTLGAERREPGRRANEALRKVRLERPFYLGTHEITNTQFRRWRSEHSSSALRGQSLDMGDQPVVNVSWNEAALFCNWLSRRDRLPPFYVEQDDEVTGWNPEAHGYRLPTEAEWAFAARVDADGNSMMFPWGTQEYPPATVLENYADQTAASIVNFVLSSYNDGFSVSAPVGSFVPNHNGLFDLGGNVSEWVHDFFEIRPVTGEPMLDPTGPARGDRHVIRGASWARASRSELRLAYRNSGRDGNLETGFRIARYVDRPRLEP